MQQFSRLQALTSVFDLVEREVALALSFGEVSLGGGILVSCDSGRSYDLAHWPSIPPGEVDGNRITVAKHAATDIMYRDLGLVMETLTSPRPTPSTAPRSRL